MDTLLMRAARRLQTAEHILAELQLLEKWRPFGTPLLVGAVAYGLVVAPDIDLEIFCDTPRIEDGFEVLRACALHPRVCKARFSNDLAGPNLGLYWQLRYRHEDGQEWKIDMWSMRGEHPGPLSSDLVEPMKRALNDETRAAILEIKEELLREPEAGCGSIHIYRAVLAGGVRTPAEFRKWLERNPPSGLLAWRPQ